MSRLDALKKQYPEFNITILDVLKNLDTSNTYKFLPLICKIFSKKFKDNDTYYPTDFEISDSLKEKGILVQNLTKVELKVFFHFSDFFTSDHFEIFKTFIQYIEKNKLLKNDVTSYSSLDEMRAAIILSDLKEIDKELEKQVIKEFEDDRWIIVRPLTFLSSVKYGSSTRWCTTYQKEKHYFEKYWRRGILIYVINKKTGYKFAGFKSLDENKELSFWSAEDQRLDLLETNIDDYLFPKLKKIFSSEYTNKNLCSDKLQEQVHQECLQSEPDTVHTIQSILSTLEYTLPTPTV